MVLPGLMITWKSGSMTDRCPLMTAVQHCTLSCLNVSDLPELSPTVQILKICDMYACVGMDCNPRVQGKHGFTHPQNAKKTAKKLIFGPTHYAKMKSAK